MTTVRTEFLGFDNKKLSARLDLPAGQPRAFALFAHCFTGSKDVFATSRIAHALAAHGIAVLRFDFTGLGASEGEFADTNFSSNVIDLVEAASYLRQAYQAPALLIGHSLGGAAVLAAAAEIAEVRAVVTIGAPSHPAHVIGQFKSYVNQIHADGQADVQIGGRPFHIKRQFLQDLGQHALANKVGRLRRALMVMHSPCDETVGIDNAMHIFSAAKHPKSFVTLDNADHFLTRKDDAIYVADMIAAWSQRYTGAGVQPQPAESAPALEQGACQLLA